MEQSSRQINGTKFKADKRNIVLGRLMEQSSRQINGTKFKAD